MSQTTTTPNYGLIKPNVNSDNDLWGDHLNKNSDTLDALIKTVQNASGVTTWNTRSGAVTLLQADVTTVLPPGAGTPAMDGTATPGALMTWSRSDHVHPTDTTRYAASNPAGYVTAAQAGTAAPVQSVATRTGAVVLTHTDITDWTPTLAPYAPLVSPALTGSPTAPTVTPTTDASTKLATTAFVQSALGAVPGGAIVSATPPTANPGALWFDSTGGQTYCRYDDGNTVQWVPVSNITGLANAAQLSDVAALTNNVGRNLIHNSMFNIAQRGAGPFTVANAYTVDRWYQWFGGAGAAMSTTPFVASDAHRSQIGDEACQQIIISTVTGTAGAGDAALFGQITEGVRRLGGKTVTVSFWAAAGAALRIGVSIDQSFGSGGSPSASVQGAGQATSVLTTTFTRYTMTFTLPSTAGKTLGTNVGTDVTTLLFWFSAGSGSATRAGNIGVQSGGFYLWGVQLEIAAPGQTQPTPLEKPDLQQDLAKCQRFFQVVGNLSFVGTCPTAAAGNQTMTSFTFPPMRAIPTAVIVGTPAYYQGSALGLTPQAPGACQPNMTAAVAGSAYAVTTAVALSADL